VQYIKNRVTNITKFLKCVYIYCCELEYSYAKCTYILQLSVLILNIANIVCKCNSWYL